MALGTLPWQPLLWSKLAKSDYSSSFVDLSFVNGVEYRNSDFKWFVCDNLWLHSLCKNLVNFSPVTPEFKKGKDVHHFVDQQFGYVAPLLDVAEISTEFYGAITTQFCFTYALEGVTAMPRGLHSRLDHAFLVAFSSFIYFCSVLVPCGRSSWLPDSFLADIIT